MNTAPQRSPSHDGRFEPTHWSVVLRAGHGTSAERQAAINTLCRSYWYPLYAFLRRSGTGLEDAEDLTQDFFARLIAERVLDAAVPERGRFRTLLLQALKNFATDKYRAAGAAKRGGGTETVPLDTALAEAHWQADPSRESSPELAYDRAWAAATLAAAAARVRAEFERAGKLPLFEALWPRVAGSGGEKNETLAQRLGMSAGAVAVAATRLRERWAGAIREEVAQAVETDAEIEDELRHLMSLFL